MVNNSDVVRIGSNDWRDQLISEMKRTGGDPSFLFELLESIIKQRAWESLLDDSGQPVGSLRRLIEAPPPVGCGQKVDKVLKLLDIEHRYEREDNEWHTRMTALRDAVKKEIGEEISALRDSPGGINQYTKTVSDISETSTISKMGGTSREYRIARLKRDAPDIAERVINGAISAAEGVRELYFRENPQEKLPNKVTFRDLNDLDEVAKKLKHHLNPSQINELFRLLMDDDEE